MPVEVAFCEGWSSLKWQPGVHHYVRLQEVYKKWLPWVWSPEVYCFVSVLLCIATSSIVYAASIANQQIGQPDYEG